MLPTPPVPNPCQCLFVYQKWCPPFYPAIHSKNAFIISHVVFLSYLQTLPKRLHMHTPFPEQLQERSYIEQYRPLGVFGIQKSPPDPGKEAAKVRLAQMSCLWRVKKTRQSITGCFCGHCFPLGPL